MMHVRRVRAAPAPTVEELPDDEPEVVAIEGETKKDTEDRIEAQYRKRATSPLRAIRAFCVICMGSQPKAVTTCSATTCVLHQFRMGKNPYQKHAAGGRTRKDKRDG